MAPDCRVHLFSRSSDRGIGNLYAGATFDEPEVKVSASDFL